MEWIKTADINALDKQTDGKINEWQRKRRNAESLGSTYDQT